MRNELRMYLKELGIEEVSEFSSGKEFAKNYFLDLILKPESIKNENSDDPPSEKKEIKKTSTPKPIDLIIFRYTDVDADTKKWVTTTATLLKKVNLWPEYRTKFIAVRYEDDHREKIEFNHPFIDDLICLPLDRLIFLQKIELALALPKKVTPSFLYVQNVTETIEISKRVTIEKVSDVGIGVANPVPLAPGIVGHFYFRFPGQKQLLDIHGKVSKSEPHPERAGEYLTYFNFFGLSKQPLKEIKAYLSRDSAYKYMLDLDPENFKHNPDNLFLTDEQKRKKTVVVLEYEENLLKSTVENINKEIDYLNVVSDDTYYSFYKKYLSQKNENAKYPPAQPEHMFGEVVSILISATDLSIQKVLTLPNETDTFLGHEALKILSEPHGWIKLFEGDSRNLLSECIHLVATAKHLTKIFEVRTLNNELLTLELEFLYEEMANTVKINFKLPSKSFANQTSNLIPIESIDCIVIDYDLLPEDIDSFSRSIASSAERVGLQCPPDGPKIIVLASENRKVNFERLLNSKVYGFIFKPAETRRLIYMVSQAIDNIFTLYNLENLGWKNDSITAKIARSAQLIELSEFGATIKSEQPIKHGTMLYLFKSIFENAPDQNLCARVYHCKEDAKDTGFYLNSMIYFGITDTFLKFTRSHIRETYAAKKSKEG